MVFRAFFMSGNQRVHKSRSDNMVLSSLCARLHSSITNFILLVLLILLARCPRNMATSCAAVSGAQYYNTNGVYACYNASIYEIPSDIPSTTTKVFLSYNRISSVSASIMQTLVNIETLTLDHNLITVLTAGALSYQTNLRSISISDNGFSLGLVLEPGWANNLLLLEILEFDRSQLTFLPGGGISSLPRLTTLSLTSNNITGLVRGAFEDLPALEVLDLRANTELGYIDTSLWTLVKHGGLQNLNIEMEGCKSMCSNSENAGVTCLCAPDFPLTDGTYCLPLQSSLTTSSTTHTTWTTSSSVNIIATTTVVDIPKVDISVAGCSHTPGFQLQCSGQLIESVPSGTGSVIYAVFINNRIRQVGPGDLTHMSTLYYLFLSKEYMLRRLVPGCFTGLNAIGRITISETMVSVIEAGVFSNLNALSKLTLNENQISLIHPGAFDTLPNLADLTLSTNHLTMISPDFFVGLANVQLLYLQQNVNLRLVLPNSFSMFGSASVYMSGCASVCSSVDGTPIVCICAPGYVGDGSYCTASPTLQPTTPVTVANAHSTVISSTTSVTSTWTTLAPLLSPTTLPTQTPTYMPTEKPSHMPTQKPTHMPTDTPTHMPTEKPTHVPTQTPTQTPTHTPTQKPTHEPTSSPSFEVTSLSPTSTPSVHPTALPSWAPSYVPSKAPTDMPSSTPSEPPTPLPSLIPTISPTYSQSLAPSLHPTNVPSLTPFVVPTTSPTTAPYLAPTSDPTKVPSLAPSVFPTAESSLASHSTPSLNPVSIPDTTPNTSTGTHDTNTTTVPMTEASQATVLTSRAQAECQGLKLGTLRFHSSQVYNSDIEIMFSYATIQQTEAVFITEGTSFQISCSSLAYGSILITLFAPANTTIHSALFAVQVLQRAVERRQLTVQVDSVVHTAIEFLADIQSPTDATTASMPGTTLTASSSENKTQVTKASTDDKDGEDGSTIILTACVVGILVVTLVVVYVVVKRIKRRQKVHIATSTSAALTRVQPNIPTLRSHHHESITSQPSLITRQQPATAGATPKPPEELPTLRSMLVKRRRESVSAQRTEHDASGVWSGGRGQGGVADGVGSPSTDRVHSPAPPSDGAGTLPPLKGLLPRAGDRTLNETRSGDDTLVVAADAVGFPNDAHAGASAGGDDGGHVAAVVQRRRSSQMIDGSHHKWREQRVNDLVIEDRMD